MTETASEHATSRGRIPRQSVIVALAIYFLTGLGLGWLWRAGFAEQDAVHGYMMWYQGKFGIGEPRNTWLGVPVWKTPLDMWVYQEIIYRTRPDVLVESGTYKGGSALFFATIFQMIGNGQVITIDIVPYLGRPENGRITYLLGSSTSNAVIEKVKSLVRQGDRVMVVLDSDHHKEHVLNELRLYSPLVTVGCYLVVEDTSWRVWPPPGQTYPNPMDAVEEFLKTNHEFTQDRDCEKFGVTTFRGGCLERTN